MANVNHARIPELNWIEQRSPSGKFRSFCRNISLALGGQRNIGTWGGGHPFDVQIRRIAAGAAVCPFHSHLAQWELFVVQSGSGVVRVGHETIAIKPGDVFVHPPGEPHQLIADGTTELEVLIVADNPPLDAFYYPDSNKWGLRPPGNFFRIADADYFDGEDPNAPAGSAASVPLPPSTNVPLTPFSTRKRHVDDIAWESWESPKKTFRGISKELSVALGAQRNAPTGLGGHPFDVELSKLLPNECGCPFHSHAAQWELYLIVHGAATMRVGEATHTLRAGDVVLNPPGEPHQIRNASVTDELVFYLIADNPPVDYWHYPDSNKWGLREPRMFFRPNKVEYYDGEE